MNTPETMKTFIHAARECAMQMMQNAIYIEAQLPTIEIPDGAVEKIQSMCQSLIGTKHDIMTELFELAACNAVPSDLTPKIERIMKWSSEPIGEMHEVVEAIREASEQDNRFSLAWMLLAESSVNVLNASNAAWDAAEALKQEAPSD